MFRKFKIRIKKSTFDNINYGINSLLKFWIKLGLWLIIALIVKILIFYVWYY